MSLFHKNKPVYARVAFNYNGKQYVPGEPFEAPQHKIVQLWFARRLTHTPIVDTPIVDTPIVDTPIVDTPIVDTPIVDTGVKAVHLGKGWYNVEMSGAVMNTEKIKGKNAAAEWALTNLGVVCP